MTTGRINQVASSRETATPTRRCEKRQHRARGIDGRKQKLGDQTRFANPTKSIGTAAFTWVHEHCGVRAFRAHPGVRLSRRGKEDGADETTAHTAGSTTRACPTRHHSHARCPHARCPARAWRSSKGAIGAAQASQDRERGTERSRRERERSKTRVGQKGRAGHLGLSRAREELKAIAQRKRGANGLCTAHTLRGKPLHRARGATSPT
ncbi:hypothetical protein H6P81_021247 [Aristolochia fimbriata]|uniref:Uncharacterized protein n=1 Tax=Aristolochia fimbriata TaxID=158543 RepID=A0AAV7DTQ6_ARIFI|nr:hypothetical protein H6P81_021247 [Aristolochia fimbriata]